jgi:hypothetical protein
MLRGKLVPPVTADKGKGHLPRQQGVGETANRLTAEIGVEQSAIDRFVLKRVERVGNRGQRPNHDEATSLKRAGDIERDEKLVLNDKNTFGCHHCPSVEAFRLDLLFPTDRFIDFGKFDQAHLLCRKRNEGTLLRLRTLDRHL